MENGNKFGMHRVIEPKGVLPQPAWKIDNKMDLNEDEILIEVETININSSSFRQICTEYDHDITKIKEMIIKIIELRGKLHNPITNTGGILLGKVKKIGNKYNNIEKLKVGDYVIPLVSLSLIPLKINKIIQMDIKSSQLQVEGEAILFSSCLVMKLEKDIRSEYLITLMDEAGSYFQSYMSSNKGDKVLIMGANGKSGLICAFAVKDKIGDTGNIVGIVHTEESKTLLEKYNIFDKVYKCDATKPLEIYNALKLSEEGLYDLTINCVNTFGTEASSILSTKDKGTIYFSNLATNYNSACLTAEGIGRDVNIIPYKGYLEGHVDFAINLFRKYKVLRELIDKWMNEDISRKLNKDEEVYTKANENIVKEINIEEFVFKSEKIKDTLKKTLRIAKFDCSVLITGESGVGKEIFAQIIHKASNRNQGPYVKINCSSIPENLLESELYGYESGAFTGANKEGKLGFFEIANGGILFLDEVGELPLSLQAKLLRAIQEKEIYRVGGISPIKIDVRIIAATNRELIQMVNQGLFRKDLFYRLNVLNIQIPPLRERKSDIIPLIKHFSDNYNRKYDMGKHFEPNALIYMSEYPWQGNIRELDNVIHRLLINTDKNLITVLDVINNLDIKEEDKDIRNFSLEEEIEKTEYRIIKEAKFNYKTTRKMAEALGLSQSTLVRKLKKYNL